MPENSPNELATNRLTQVFRFLKGLNELRNPVQREVSDYPDVLRIDTWPAHPCIIVQRGDRIDDEDEEETGTETEMQPLVQIRRAQLTPCPMPPKILDGWLKPGWQAYDGDVEVLVSRNFLDENKDTVTVMFDEDVRRTAGLEQWRAVRTKWQVAERPAVQARRLFERVHALWTGLQRDGDLVELVLADGMLSVPKESVRHPVLLQRVSLEFDPSLPELRFSTGLEKVELHRALLRLVPAIQGHMIAHFDTELELHPVEPLGGQSTTGFFKCLAQGLFTDCEFVECKDESVEHEGPAIWREPLIIVRPRTAGLSATLDKIIEDLENEAPPPAGLSRIVGIETGMAATATSGESKGEQTQISGKQPADILFSKPANAEQYEIAERLAHSNAVLVQGPPGTGKTHTIANLLGCLLAQGKTVLVTAHTVKALRVLRGQIESSLQPLCLSVLDRDGESQAELARAAQEIAERLSRSNPANLRQQAGMLRANRQKLHEIATLLRRQIRDARFSEIEEIVVSGQGISPIEAAKRVKAGTLTESWIPGPLHVGTTCPLTDAEIRQLYMTNEWVCQSDEAQLGVLQPDLERLVSAAEFRMLANERDGTKSRAETHLPHFWRLEVVSACKADQLQKLQQRVSAAATLLAEEQNWLREVLFSGWMGGDLRGAWDDLIIGAHELSAQAAAAQRCIMEFGPELPESVGLPAMVSTLAAIVAHIEGGSSLGLMTKLTRREWHQLLDQCRVDGKPPTTIAEIKSLRSLADLRMLRDKFLARWRRAVEALGGPKIETGNNPERAAQGYVADIQDRLDWRERVWEPLVAELNAAGFYWDKWLAAHPAESGDHGELARVQRAGTQSLVAVVEAQAALLRQVELAADLQSQQTYLSGFPHSDAASVCLSAQGDWKVEHYEEACRELARLTGLREAYEMRKDLLVRVEKVAPAWSHAIRRREGPHGASVPPGDVLAAWQWRHWHQELERRGKLSMPELQEKLDATETQLRKLAAEIIDNETWAAQCERTNLFSRQALMGFVQTIQRIGKGTGKRAPSLLKEARALLASARRSVPVWIMPLHRVYESFDARQTKFDVVIIDEASQSDVTALAALYLGREHVVVGDKEQVTPDAIGQGVEEVQRLIATDLRGIPCSHLYDGQTSIYDLAEQAFGGVVALREHFRCVPPIIQFSNHLSYKTILPLREPASSPVRPALVAHRVSGYRDDRKKLNQVEAEEIASLIVACLNEPAYAKNDFGLPSSFGVISLVGSEQARLIENLLRPVLPDDVWQKHRLQCGNAAQFQGDERDIIFLSMVDGPPEDGQCRLLSNGPRDIYKKRYNVAVSRARNQLWVVHSLDPDKHLQAGDLRRRLIEHARDPQSLMREMEMQGEKTESIFEKLVVEHLVNSGYRVRPQWPVGSRRIDLVVEGTKAKLAIECDGERWHTPEQLHQDLERQAVLERLGWRFVRIRGSLFFRDENAAMAPVYVKLAQLGIEPLGAAAEPASPETDTLIESIKRMADALRAEWYKTDGDSGRAQEEGKINSQEPEAPEPAPMPPGPMPEGSQPSDDLPLWRAHVQVVELSDSVRYCFADALDELEFVIIVDTPSNADLGMINRETDLAKALLGMRVGQEREVDLPMGKRVIRVAELHKPANRSQNRDLLADLGVELESDLGREEGARKQRSGELHISGQRYPYSNAKEAMVLVLRRLAETDPNLLERCAKHPQSRGTTRRYIARTPAELYPGRPDLRSHHHELPGGWVVATNLDNETKRTIVQLVSEAAGLTFGKDVIIDF
jgi:very-short-patch-repair endonuclease